MNAFVLPLQTTAPMGLIPSVPSLLCAPSGRDATCRVRHHRGCHCLLVEERIVLVVVLLLSEEGVVGIT